MASCSSTAAMCILKVGVVTSEDNILRPSWGLDNLGTSQKPNSEQEHNAEVQKEEWSLRSCAAMGEKPERGRR